MAAGTGKDTRSGSQPLAGGVHPAPGLPHELYGYTVRTQLADFKRPRWVRFVPALPKTATGKIQRFKLREMASTADPPA